MSERPDIIDVAQALRDQFPGLAVFYGDSSAGLYLRCELEGWVWERKAMTSAQSAYHAAFDAVADELKRRAGFV